METTNNMDVLSDLIEINNDRIKGFKKAAEDLEPADADLKPLFHKMVADSTQNVAELRGMTGAAGDTGTSVLGDIHRAWIDVKATFTGNDRKSILAECERGEDAIKKAYKSALEDGQKLTPEALETVSRQNQKIIAGHNEIRALRDSAA